MLMVRINHTSGKGSARFVQPVRARAVLRWTDAEQTLLDDAIAKGLDLDEAHALFPYRTRDSVKDRYYRSREPQDRDDPASLSDARRQKDAAEGSARLLEAMRAAGLVPEQKKAG
jgi:hypothetical protein